MVNRSTLKGDSSLPVRYSIWEHSPGKIVLIVTASCGTSMEQLDTLIFMGQTYSPPKTLTVQIRLRKARSRYTVDWDE